VLVNNFNNQLWGEGGARGTWFVALATFYGVNTPPQPMSSYQSDVMEYEVEK
jgi:hypothetical protein